MANVEHHDLYDYAEQGSSPSTPASGYGRWYFKSADHRPYWKDSTGAEFKAAPDPLTTKGDLPTFDTAVNRLAVGADAAKLEADSTQSTGLAWVARQSVRAYNSANISVADSTDVALTFDSERWDTNALHSTSSNTGRLTAAIAGHYLITANVEWATNSTKERHVRIRLNGTTVLAKAAASGGNAANPTGQSVTTLYQLAATDYVEVVAWQNSGGALNVQASANYSPEFTMVRVA